MRHTSRSDALGLRDGGAVAAPGSDTSAVIVVESMLIGVAAARLALQRVYRTPTRLNCKRHRQTQNH